MRYIGNKTRILSEINNIVHEKTVKCDVFCDLFSGTSSVGDFFKSEYKIISNDFMYYSYIISKGKLLNNKEPSFVKFKNEFKVSPFVYFNEKKYFLQDNYLVSHNFSPLGNRMFFSLENSIKIDGIRLEIEELYKNKIFNEKEYSFLLASLLASVNKIANITGTYEAFLKFWDPRSTKKLNFAALEISSTKNIKKNEIYNKDANELIREIEGDILYLDPPYTVTEYSSAYHVLETIAKYDYPEIAGITGRRKDNKKKSSFTRKQIALNSFEDLIKQANFKYIIISYSNQSVIPLPELKEMLKKYAIGNKIIKRTIPFREYRNIRSSKKGNKLEEVLFLIEKDLSVLKSPLNYSGSKNNLFLQIQKYFPGKITTFVDAMGGAFNVGANVVADKIIYNEYNPYVYEVVKLISLTNKTELIASVEKIIKKHQLKKGDNEKYNKFRGFYNKNQTPLNLFVLSMFCFQNQLRFNNSKKFNTPVGNCSYNSSLKERIKKFKPKTINIEFINGDYEKLDLKSFDEETLFYFDPPYFITTATYNDGKRGFNGWDSDSESTLLSYLTGLHLKGYKFMLSNVLCHKGKTNHLLKEWVDTYGFQIIELDAKGRKEILVINYELNGGIRK